MEIFTTETDIHYASAKVEETPHVVKKGVIYVVNSNDENNLAVFSCPCGCGDTIQLNLSKEHRPSWTIQYHHPKIVSIYPSIEKTTGCQSNFSVWMGKVTWNQI